MRILVCGGAGFIGSNFVRSLLNKNEDVEIINYDKLTYAGNLLNLTDVEKNEKYKFVNDDITNYAGINKVISDVDYVVNFAAETHVDRSIHMDSREFVMTNVIGVHTILEAIRHNNNKIRMFIQISTDEVYGSLSLKNNDKFTESTPIQPNVPYAAAKAGGDLLCRAYYETYNVPVIVTHCSNNYGPFQYPEKMIPYFIMLADNNQHLPLYGDGKNVRDWIHVGDHCSVIESLLLKGKKGDVYNIGADNERSNIEVAKMILKMMNKSESFINYVNDRPGHDRRYAIDATKVKKITGWKPVYSKERFKEGLKNTINWYLSNRGWINTIKEKTSLNPHIQKK